FLAALLGVGGIADKVKKFFQALSKPVMKAVDWVVGKIVGFGKKIWAKLKGSFKGKNGTDERDEKRKQKDLDAGLDAANSLVERKMPREEIEKRLPGIKSKYRMQELKLVVTGHEGKEDRVHVEGKVNPSGKRDDKFVPGAFDSIDPNEKGQDDFRFTGDGHVSKAGGEYSITTTVEYYENKQKKATGHVTNVFNPDTFELSLKEHFLDAIPNDKRWITAPAVPIVPGKGTRLITYVNLRQLKKFEEYAGNEAVKAAKADLRAKGLPASALTAAQEADLRKGKKLFGAIKAVKLDTVENIPALLQVHRDAGLKRGAEMDEAMMRSVSVPYVNLIMLQLGCKVVSAKVSGGDETTVGALMAHYEGQVSKKRLPEMQAYHNQLLAEYGVSRSTTILASFNVELKIELDNHAT
ncbi:hypothetical protein, partial [Actinorhabdospora filicis]|uniref:hypothetical protein n=1 Tax=Actinorhabdospora filicis TaxID=1785913 RepID=UPI002556450D